jgi:carboxylesterase type B
VLFSDSPSLFINVWTPGNATISSKVPVKVWIHGGGDEGGGVNNPLYDGCYTATDSILVAMNYRLGPLGGLSSTTLGLTGNYHIQDLLLALQWVQENIAAFGGDPVRTLSNFREHILLTFLDRLK